MNFLYIDPGTGSMLFSLALGVATTLVFAIRALAVKLRFVFSGGKADKISSEKIPFVIFSDHKRYWNVFKPICDEFERRKIPLVFYTQSADDPALSERYEFVKAEFIGEGNKGFVKMNMLNAGTVLSTTPGLDVLQWKRSKNVERYVHIPHSLDEMGGYRMFALDFYDAVIATGKNQEDLVREIESLRPTIKKKEVAIVGSPYMDRNLTRVKNLPPHVQDKENLLVLFAPSWGESGSLAKFGEKMLSTLVATGFKIIIRPHPQTVQSEKAILSPLMEKYKNSVEWNFDNDNLVVMSRADILISDFSGIMLEFAMLFNRPVMYRNSENNDYSVYDYAWIDHEKWMFLAAGKYGVQFSEKDFPNFKELILKAIESSEIEKGIQEVKSECWENVGGAAKSAMDFLTKMEEKKHD